MNVFYYDEIDSTNNEAKRRIEKADDALSLDGTVIVAASQTAGRGRMGRAFYSPPGKGLYLSLIYAPRDGNIMPPAMLTSLAAVGLCRAIKSVYGADAQIKWVNDIFLRGRKVCGILAEGVAQSGQVSCALVGIGVNVLPQDFPPEIATTAGSILEDESADAKLRELGIAIAENVFALYKAHEAHGEKSAETRKIREDALDEYRKRSMLIGKKITVHPLVSGAEREFNAIVRGITDDARLVVETANGETRTLDSCEVTLHSNEVARKNVAAKKCGFPL